MPILEFHQAALEVETVSQAVWKVEQGGKKREREFTGIKNVSSRKISHGVNETLGTFGYIVSNFGGGEERRCG